MATPIEEQIAANVLTRIASITTGNSYEQTLIAERPNKKRGNRLRDLLAVVYEEDRDPRESAQSLEEWTKQFAVAVYLIESEASSTLIDTRANTVAADVEKAVATDRFWSSLATNTTLRGTERFDVETGDMAGIVIYFDVHYRTPEADPYS